MKPPHANSQNFRGGISTKNKGGGCRIPLYAPENTQNRINSDCDPVAGNTIIEVDEGVKAYCLGRCVSGLMRGKTTHRGDMYTKYLLPLTGGLLPLPPLFSQETASQEVASPPGITGFPGNRLSTLTFTRSYDNRR